MTAAAQMYNLGVNIAGMARTVENQEIQINKYRMKAAMYKAGFFHRFDLYDKLEAQNEENHNAEIGEFDGFSYSSARRSAIYRTLEDMAQEGLITAEEYEFCSI